ncbi:NADH:flavin oxidoreductase [Candidatus Solincola tengchongensis]|uniref:NADH:flavin oxidoreductase n=1 Tax=Candidatus Solincola tengchongensis TaxID=2900693 RepID=UPI00257A0F0D|nr:NADH:flavin oxidoreductase [Candidatus Solincola tengchongensis]
MTESITGERDLFRPGNIGGLELPNRFVHSATCENMATSSGEVTDRLVERYRRLARGEVGLIITGHMYVQPSGKAHAFQTGIYADGLVPGLRRLVEEVHGEGGRIVFQISHAGRQTTRKLIASRPMGPSDHRRDPLFLVKPRRMTEAEILEVLTAFREAARRAVEAGADGVQIHAAHGYLVNQFLSPFFNRRDDAWGGDDERRFRFLGEIIRAVREILPPERPLLVKLNADDCTPQEGITPSLAARYVEWMSGMGVDAVEISRGGWFNFLETLRGEVPLREMVYISPWWKKFPAYLLMRREVGRHDLVEAYNLEAARAVRPFLGRGKLILVGGLRTLERIRELLTEGEADFVSLCRPLIREPDLVRKFRQGRASGASCTSCNRCIVAITYELPVACYRETSLRRMRPRRWETAQRPEGLRHTAWSPPPDQTA